MGYPKRQVKKPEFFNPGDSTRKTYMRSVLTTVEHCLKSDSYRKDDSSMVCPKKNEINDFFSGLIRRSDSKCLILDGKMARTSTVLLSNRNVSTIDVPNYSSAYSSLKNKKGINAYPVSLYDFVTFTNAVYDAMYLDTCGHFSTKNDYRDLKSSLKVIFRRNILKEDAVIGFTVSKRAERTQWEQSLDFMLMNNFKLIYENKYGNMCTMFFTKKSGDCKSGHPMRSCIVGNRHIVCDECKQNQKPYTITISCETCDYDICSVCHNFKHNI
jgi:hypothetical protein